jgi:hypothetical protein
LQSKTDTITVPAGTFMNCYRFWFEFAGMDNDFVEWFAPGVGPVKRILYGFAVIEYPLISAWVNGELYPTKVTEPPDDKVPEKFYLHPNYPNPFNSCTKITFKLPIEEHVLLNIYNISGQHIRTLANESKAAGTYSVSWDGCDETGQVVSSGIYIFKIKAGRYEDLRKMTFIK